MENLPENKNSVVSEAVNNLKECGASPSVIALMKSMDNAMDNPVANKEYEAAKSSGFSQQSILKTCFDNNKHNTIVSALLGGGAMGGVFAVSSPFIQKGLPVKASILRASGVGFVIGAIYNAVGTIYSNHQIEKEKAKYLGFVEKIEVERTTKSDKHFKI